MADKSAIEWTDASWNPVVGCSIVSPGCTNCYAMGEAARQVRCAAGTKRDTHYAGTTKIVNGKPVWTGKVALAPDHILTLPLRWKRGRKVFVNSMGDLFHENVPDEWIDKVFAVMALSPQHTFQVLTKRAERMQTYFTAPHPATNVNAWHARACEAIDALYPERTASSVRGKVTLATGRPLPNVWLGVSTERQQEADERIPLLLQTPAAVRFISAEPLLGPVDIDCPSIDWMEYPEGNGIVGDKLKIDWVIIGGESGPGARPMHPDWVRSLRDQCAAANVPLFFKQWGQFAPFCEDDCKWLADHPADDPDFDKKRGIIELDRGQFMMRMQKKSAGRFLDGKEHNEFPLARAEASS